MQTNTEQTTANLSSNRKAIFSIVCGSHFINHFQSFWTVITGGVMTKYGFGPAFSVISISYLFAMSLLVFLRVPAKGPGLAQERSHHMRQ